MEQKKRLRKLCRRYLKIWSGKIKIPLRIFIIEGYNFWPTGIKTRKRVHPRNKFVSDFLVWNRTKFSSGMNPFTSFHSSLTTFSLTDTLHTEFNQKFRCRMLSNFRIKTVKCLSTHIIKSESLRIVLCGENFIVTSGYTYSLEYL